MTSENPDIIAMAGKQPERNEPDVSPEARALIDAYKKRMHAIKDENILDDPELTDEKKQALLKGGLKKINEYKISRILALRAKLEEKLGEMEEEEEGEGPLTVTIAEKEKKEIFEPLAKRRKALAEAAKAKGITVEDGITINEQSGEITFDRAQHEKYWKEFWETYDIAYQPQGTLDESKVKELLNKGMDFFLGMPEITPDQLREIYAKEQLPIWNPERLDLPSINRQGLPEANYALALKMAKEIAKHETEGDTQLKKNDINFSVARELAKQAGLRGLTYKEYAILQLWYNRTTGKHLDERSWTWLLDQQASSPGLAANASYNDGKVLLNENVPGNHYGNGGVRLSDIVFLET